MIGAIASHYVVATGGTGYSGAVLADAPLAYYRLGETSGTTMVDSSGNAHDGTYSGSYTLGAAGLLTGDADKSVDWLGGVGTVPLASWMQTTGLTIEALVVTDTLSTTDVIAARADWAQGFGPAYSWALYREADHFRVEVFRNNSSTVAAINSGALTTGTVYHVAATYDGTTVRLYVNGAEVGNAALTAPLSPGTSPLTIGRTPYAGDGGFDGRIDEVAFYGVALSSTRIAAHYAASGYSAAVRADSPLAYYRLGEASGTTLVDSSGSARNGVYANAPTLAAAGLVTGDTNTAVNFDGANDLAYVTSAAWMDVTSFTIEAIVKPDVVTGDRIIASRTDWSVGPTSSNRSWHLMIQGGQFAVGLTMTDGTNIDAKVGPTVTAGTKYHCALTRDAAGDAVLYLNGSSVWSSAAFAGKTLANPARDFCISGESAYKTLGMFDGIIDEVAFYGSALSASKIAAHYATV